jgi:hypothetical protein
MRKTALFLFLLAAASCDELQDPPPASPIVPASAGSWEGTRN